MGLLPVGAALFLRAVQEEGKAHGITLLPGGDRHLRVAAGVGAVRRLPWTLYSKAMTVMVLEPSLLRLTSPRETG